MAIIKKFTSYQNLSNYNVRVDDINPNSDYFRITEFRETFTGGKNAFLIEGSPFLKETTEIKIEILDVDGNPVYYEPGDGIPEYYEGLSKVVSVHIYPDTPIGLGKITILGELKQYVDELGIIRDISDEWKGAYNVKWEKNFQINRNLQNESAVRFYKRPQVNITEIVKPIFNKTIPTKTVSGSVSGEPIQPGTGTNISTWRAGTLYRLTLSSGSWDKDIDENPINISVNGNSFNPTIIEVLNDRQVLVDTPYSENNLVQPFSSQSFTSSYQDFENEIPGESSLTGSFAKIDLTQLKTFAGDVARVKIYRRSRNEVGDFQFVQESRLESTELLRDIFVSDAVEIPYGNFSNDVLDTYWTASSIDHPITVDSSILSQAVKVDYNGSGIQRLRTSEPFNISKDVEYELSFKTLLSGSTTSDKYLRAYLTGSFVNSNSQVSQFEQNFVFISGSGVFTTRQNVSQNILAERDITASLAFEFKGDDWYLSQVSLKNAQETSFSPDEFTLVQPIPRKLEKETFDFRFEFYDINNNYIPVDVNATKEFDGGNDYVVGGTSARILTFESDRNAFRYASGSASPNSQTILFQVTKTNLTGSILYESSAFDQGGNFLTSSGWEQYPGLLTLTTDSISGGSSTLTVTNFSGSWTGSGTQPEVYSIVYTASVEDLQEFETVFRVEDGDNAPQLLVTSNANQFIYEPTTLSPKPSGQSITIRAQRKNLESLNSTITVTSGSNLPTLTVVSDTGGVKTYSISALEFSSSFAQNDFDEVTYNFSSNDVFGVAQTDQITISKVINFDGVSLVLSNESTTFPANSTGEVLSGFAASSGSIQMYIGANQIQFDDTLSKNTFAITNLQGSGCTPFGGNGYDPVNNSYSITAMNQDSASMEVTITYKAGDNTTTQEFQKVVSYTKAKKAVPTVLTKTSPTTQTINSSSLGFEIPQTVEVILQEGGDEYTYSGTLAIPKSFRISNIGTTAGSATNLNEIITLNTGSGTFNGLLGSASVDYKDSEGTEVYDKLVRFDLSVSKIGVDGLNGASGSDAKTVNLTASQYRVEYDGDGNKTAVAIVLTATPQNFSDPHYEFTENGVVRQAYSTTATYTIPDGEEPAVGVVDLWQVNVKEGNLGSVVAFDNIDVFGLKEGSDAFTVFLTNEAHTFPGDTSGVPTTYSGGSTEVRMFRGTQQYTYDGTSPYAANSYRIGTVTATGITMTQTTVSSQRVFTPSAATATSGTVVIPVIDNSTGTVFNKTYTFSVSTKGTNGPDGPAGSNGVVVNLSLSSQTVKRSTNGTYATPSIFTVTVVENGTLLTHQSGTSTPATSYFTITSLTNGTLSAGSGTTTPDITPTTPTTTGGLTTTFNITYTDSKGNTSSAIAQSHVVNVSLDGTTGPGVVHTGVWESGRAYQYSDGLTAGTGRRDTVLWSANGSAPYDTYYATNTSHTATNNSSTSTGRPDLGGPWTSLGTQDFFVAAKIGIFEDSFVQNTLNIGKNNNGGASSANITLAGGTTNPYISIGQSELVGSQGYNLDGIFLGQDSGVSKLSLKSASNSLLWDGTNLTVNGGGTFTGDLSAAGGTFSGDLSAAGGTFSGKITAGGMSLGNDVNGASDGIYIDANDYWYSDGSFSLGNGNLTWDGTGLVISGSGTFSGDLQAAGGTFNGSVNITSNAFTVTAGDGSNRVALFDNDAEDASYISITNTGGGVLIGESNGTAGLYPVGASDIDTYVFSGDVTAFQIGNNVSTVQISNGGSSGISIAPNAATCLYYNASSKVCTTNTGIAVTGAITATGNITAFFSDDRLKTRLNNISDALLKIKSLNGFEFELNETSKKLGVEDDGIQIGVSAQEVQKVLPQIVKPAPIDNNYLTVQYERLIPLLIEGIKELSDKVEYLENEIFKLKQGK